MDENAMSNILGSLITKDSNGGFGGANGMWAFLLILLFAGNGFGFGGFGNNGAVSAMANAATQQDVANGFAMQNLVTDVKGIGSDINQLGYNLQSAITNSGYQVADKVGDVGNAAMMAIAQNGFGTQSGLNAVGQNIDRLRYDTALQTCNITENATANTQKILDRLCALETGQLQSKVNELQIQLQAAQLQAANTAQTGQIIGSLRPYPVPAYTVSSPYGVTTPTTGGTTTTG